MTSQIRAAGVVAWALLAGGGALTAGQEPGAKAQKGAAVTQRASGTFEVKVAPVTDREGSVAASRMTIDKTLQGDLVGTSHGEMWTAAAGVEGSGGYVAIEKVDGTLRGRRGTFTLLHQGTMRHGGDFKLTIVVVPDSGTGELSGLGGTLAIVIAGGKHSYEFDYTLP
jgi:uncharacterized protein DUF3224